MPSGTWLLILLAISAISWIWGKVQEQKEARDARDRMRNRQEQMARQTAASGGPVASSRPLPTRPTQAPGERSIPPDAVSARRQAQLEELRRRGQLRRQQGEVAAPGPPRQPQQNEVGPELITSEERRRIEEMLQRREAQRRARTEPPRQPQQQPRQSPRPTQRRPEPPQAQRPPRRQAPPVQQQSRTPARPAPAPAPEPTTRRQRTAADEVRALLQSAHGPRSRKRLQAVIALSEVLSTPMAARSTDQLPWWRSGA
ncbi:MAG: hypothetical protein AAGI30_09630 [Planctomycetota bacterium]